MLQCSAKILLLAACTVILLHRYSVTKCVLPEICSLFMPYMAKSDKDDQICTYRMTGDLVSATDIMDKFNLTLYRICYI